MSLKKHEGAILEGFEAPVFPNFIKLIILLFEQQHFSWDQVDLEEVLKKVSCYSKMENSVKTSDDYNWLKAIYFDTPDGQICLALPFIQDRKMDCSPAIYLSNLKIRKKQFNVAIGEFLIEMFEYYEEHASW